METVSYRGWPNCVRLANKKAELIVTTDVGPRVIHFSLLDGENVFCVLEGDAGQTGGDEWRNYGGHRLWHAPEMIPRTYFPDNTPVEASEKNGVVTISQPTETTTGIKKEIEISLSKKDAHVVIKHRLTNTNLWAVEFAPWALSVMTTGGVAVAPLPPRGTHPENMLPVSALATWAYTDMSDPRWTWGKEYILLRQDPAATTPQKIGISDTKGWAAYVVANTMFVKTFKKIEGVTYPDMGASVEMFTNADILEVETVGPLAPVGAGETVEHVENWYLFGDMDAPQSEADVEKNILPIIRKISG
ncbi:MAG: hypothetical protein JXJ17_09690 [Anaerolineae bacterium]|nr:hypothetical protein [Anaerolineae bacterium]